MIKREEWHKVAFEDRVAQLVALGVDKEEAEEYAEEAWGTLPLNIRKKLEGR